MDLMCCIHSYTTYLEERSLNYLSFKKWLSLAELKRSKDPNCVTSCYSRENKETYENLSQRKDSKQKVEFFICQQGGRFKIYGFNGQPKKAKKGDCSSAESIVHLNSNEVQNISDNPSFFFLPSHQFSLTVWHFINIYICLLPVMATLTTPDRNDCQNEVRV